MTKDVDQATQDQLESLTQELAEAKQIAEEKERVIQSFRSSRTYWLVNGPFRHLIPLKDFMRRVRKSKRYYFFGAIIGSKLGVLRQHAPRAVALSPWYLRTPADFPADAPVISIVTPSYNQQRFIQRTIKSVVDQSYPNLEYIIQDGGSTDGTLETLESYKEQLASWTSQKDSGQAHALNLGFQRTTGEIMAWLNSDDMLLPGTLHYVANYFMSNPEVDVIYGHRVIMDESDHEIGRWLLPPHDPKAVLYVDYIPQETLFWRRRIWEKAGGQLDESYKFALDWELILRFQHMGAVIKCLPRFMGMFRVHSEQKTSMLIETIGRDEMDRLRAQYIGPLVNQYKAMMIILNYLIRSSIYFLLYQLGLLRY